MSAPDPLASPISAVCKDCRNVRWCIPTRQCLIARLSKSEAIHGKRPSDEHQRVADDGCAAMTKANP